MSEAMSTAPTAARPAPALPDVAGRRPADYTLVGQLRRRLARDPFALVAMALLAVIALAVILAPVLAPRDPYAVNNAMRLRPPGTPGFPLGADEIGRDILSRLLWGGQVSLPVAIVPALLALTIGSTLGLIAGYLGGWVDHLLMRLLDIVLAFPYILLAIAIATALGPGLTNAILAVTIIAIPVFARLMRSTVLSLRAQDFILAAQTLGATTPRILLRHILPNAISILIVYGTLQTGNMVIASASLSFLGLGVQPPTADWGGMLAAGRTSMTAAPHVATIPGLVIFAVTLAFNIVGEAFRDALDPRAARRD